MNRNSQLSDGKFAARQTAYEEIDRRTSEITTGLLWVVIPYTTPELTRAALRHAGVCSDLDAHVSLVDVQVVPFPCALDEPPINSEYSRRRLQELFNENRLPGRAAVLYTRDWLGSFCRALEP